MISTDVNAYLAEWRDRPFRPGSADCALFAAGWIERMTGRDVAAAWRGRYRSLGRGRALLAEAGYPDLASLASSVAHELAHPSMVLPGDVAIVIEEGVEAFGIAGSPFIHVLAPHGGLDVVPLSRAVRVYRP